MDYADLLVLPVARGFAFAKASLLTATISGSASLANVTGLRGKWTILISAVSLASDQGTRTCPVFLLSFSLPTIHIRRHTTSFYPSSYALHRPSDDCSDYGWSST